MRLLLAALACAALGLFVTAQILAGMLGLARYLGFLGAVAGIVALPFRFTLPLRVGVVLTAVGLWHWPLILAIVFAAPRWLLMIPGLFSTWNAQRRHPRPLWQPLPARAIAGAPPGQAHAAHDRAP
jgi:hypothetical protein